MIQKLSQKQKMLNLLKQRGLEGVSNYEFSHDLFILNYTKRLSELYASGYNIQKEFKGKGIFKYVLVPEREFGEIS